MISSDENRAVRLLLMIGTSAQSVRRGHRTGDQVVWKAGSVRGSREPNIDMRKLVPGVNIKIVACKKVVDFFPGFHNEITVFLAGLCWDCRADITNAVASVSKKFYA
ncbi:hypothetical protein WYI_21840 [Ochrobactrum sp. CDB2]|nr:hypothetical protein WYI_21840 [Ochrobactrum sp. CDB2]